MLLQIPQSPISPVPQKIEGKFNAGMDTSLLPELVSSAFNKGSLEEFPSLSVFAVWSEEWGDTFSSIVAGMGTSLPELVSSLASLEEFPSLSISAVLLEEWEDMLSSIVSSLGVLRKERLRKFLRCRTIVKCYLIKRIT